MHEVRICFSCRLTGHLLIFGTIFILEMTVLILEEQKQTLAFLLQHTVDKNNSTGITADLLPQVGL